jgi:hypothetical protein
MITGIVIGLIIGLPSGGVLVHKVSKKFRRGH